MLIYANWLMLILLFPPLCEAVSAATYIRGKCKCHMLLNILYPLPASCCSTCTCEHLSECSNEFSSTPPFGGTVHQMPNTITDAGGNHCKIQLKTLDIFHQTQLSLWVCLRPLRAYFSPCGGQTGGTMRSTLFKTLLKIFQTLVFQLVLGASLAVYSSIHRQPGCYHLFW